MNNIKLYKHQIEALEKTKSLNRVAYFLDMGLGKTFVGSEKMINLGERVNLIICQKSKVEDWIEHFKSNYDAEIYDLTKKTGMRCFLSYAHKMYINGTDVVFGVINYDLAFRRKELLELSNFTLMLDESSMIQNETAKRTKFILKMNAKNVILLSGTPTSGKYEKLYSQIKLLGWKISKKLYWDQYINFVLIDIGGAKIQQVVGYKNVDRLKQKLREHGAVFMKSEEAFDLPEQIHNIINVKPIPEYKKFMKDLVVTINDVDLVGDTSLTKLLYARQLCGSYCDNKIEALRDLMESTNERLIVFYNFNNELKEIEKLCVDLDKHLSIVNGQHKNLFAYNNFENSVTAIQYQAGAMGLNLQEANKIIYYTLPLSSELFEQSKKRIHRIGQENSCFYYYLICKGTVEEKILETLKMRKDYTDELFREE